MVAGVSPACAALTTDAGTSMLAISMREGCETLAVGSIRRRPNETVLRRIFSP
jgi:hypothetical protein